MFSPIPGLVCSWFSLAVFLFPVPFHCLPGGGAQEMDQDLGCLQTLRSSASQHLLGLALRYHFLKQMLEGTSFWKSPSTPHPRAVFLFFVLSA